MTFCSKCLSPLGHKYRETLDLIKHEYLSNDTSWYLGYSGGKDSSAVLKLLIIALAELKQFHKQVSIIYCDTGVEIPTIAKYVKITIKKLKNECNDLRLPLKFIIAKPKIEDRYFVKVIGRGYPPPTNIFRWCTDRLRINPVKNIIDNEKDSIVLLGVRKGESQERDKTITKHNTALRYYLNQGNSNKTKIFSPIIDYSLEDIWASLKFNSIPTSIDHQIIGQLYKDAGSECPVYRETKGTPCGKGRFGCWTCTVVRKDKSVQSMIENGYSNLSALFEFRNWLSAFRDDVNFRCRYRRNGNLGLGPITLEGRRLILKKLLRTQNKSGLKLIPKEELVKIKELWGIDKNNRKYLALEKKTR